MIYVGSTNEVKIRAVQKEVWQHPLLKTLQVVGCKARSGISEQPMSLDEITLGALARATVAYKHALETSTKRHSREFHLGIGLEDGLMNAPGTESGYANICVCAIKYAQQKDEPIIKLGWSSAFEWPKKIMDIILRDNAGEFRKDTTIDDALKELGISCDAYLGKGKGGIYLVSGKRIAREAYTQEAVRNALFSIIR